MQKKFTRTIEDFVCEQCHTPIKGTGFTNHCSHCLWSKHVDVHPGDRAATCGGMMEPVAVEKSVAGEYVIAQRCQLCGFTRKNKVTAGDNFDEIVRISANQASRFAFGA